MLPFLALGIAVALRERRTPTLALAAPSAVGMLAATIAEPQLVGMDTGRWQDLLADGDLQFTVFGAVGGGHGWLPMLPFLALVAAAVALAARSVPAGGAARRHEAAAGGGAVAAWALVALLLGNAPLLVGAGALAGVGAAVWSGSRGTCSARDPSRVPSTASSTTATPRS
jgi:hypothetical protein